MNDKDDVLGLYRSMASRELRQLRLAYDLDRTQAIRDHREMTINFCAQRVVWIDQVLHERSWRVDPRPNVRVDRPSITRLTPPVQDD